MKQWLAWAFVLPACATNGSYMMPAHSLQCPIAATPAECQAAIEKVCGAGYVVLLTRPSKDNDHYVIVVSCEANTQPVFDQQTK